MTTETLPRPDMSTWRFIWRLIRYRPVPWIFNNLSYLNFMLAQVIGGLVTREFFNLISQQAPASFNFWTLMAFLGVVGVARVGSVFSGTRTFTGFAAHCFTLL